MDVLKGSVISICCVDAPFFTVLTSSDVWFTWILVYSAAFSIRESHLTKCEGGCKQCASKVVCCGLCLIVPERTLQLFTVLSRQDVHGISKGKQHDVNGKFSVTKSRNRRYPL